MPANLMFYLWQCKLYKLEYNYPNKSFFALDSNKLVFLNLAFESKQLVRNNGGPKLAFTTSNMFNSKPV